MRKLAIGLAFVLATISGGVAQGQQVPEGGQDGGILVEGRKQGPRKEARRFVERIVTTTKDQLSRFNDPVCPVVLGLTPPYAKAIVKRFREVSAEVGAQVDRDEKCYPNVFVIVAADAGAIIAQLREKYHGFFRDLAYDDKRTALDEGPVRAWRVSEELDQSGRPGAQGPDGLRSFRGIDPGSRISLSTQQATYAAVVVIDVNAIDEKSVGQIADYVAMRVLAGARPPKEGGRLDTILTLFDGDAVVPEGLTQVDRSFLTGIYQMQANAPLGSQAGTIADRIVRDARETGTAKKPRQHRAPKLPDGQARPRAIRPYRERSVQPAHSTRRGLGRIDSMRMPFCLASLLLLSMAGAPLAPAQDAKPAQDGGIVVTGKGPEPIGKARRYLRQVLESDSGQLARFVDPVCPLVLGLPERFRAPIDERFRIVAGASSVRLARGKCRPNLMIVFADNADALIETMRKRRNAAFADLDEGALRDAFKAGPIHAWRLVVTRDDMGNVATGDEDPDFPTIFESETQAVTINSVIVMDKRAAQGKSVRQIADYAVMRTLVGARPPDKGSIAAASILSLFDPAVAPPPAEITDMDLGLLSGLYRLRDPYAQGGDQAYRISRTMVTGRPRQRASPAGQRDAISMARPI